MAKLLELLNELDACIPHQHVTRPGVSNASVGWHIEHSILTFCLVINRITESDPKQYSPKFSFIKFFILTFKKIPRGKGRAPDIVKPVQEITPASLMQGVAKARQKAGEILKLDSNSYFEHPYFGHLNLASTKKFLEIHTKHHLDIIRDILK
jgi:hypothetical protein